MGDTKIQIHDDYCKNISPKEISDILDRLSAIISASYTRAHNRCGFSRTFVRCNRNS